MKKESIICLIVTLIFGFICYYFMLPAINLQSLGFWAFVGLILAFYSISIFSTSIDRWGRIKNVNKTTIISFSTIFVIIIGVLFINFVASPLFHSKSYSERIAINENGNFTEDVKQVDFNALPLLDKESSSKLGDRVMGQLPEMVSQYYVADNYTQINYNDNIIRVTPLEYNGFFKYLNNRKEGISGYITVNSVTGESSLIKLDEGMKYAPSAIFNEDLYRKLRFSYPFDVFGDMNFEIDNDGRPYWIVPVMKFSAVGLKRDVNAVIIFDPVTGSSEKYKVEDAPTWVDHVYESDLIIEQVDNWGMYKNGFLNSIFGQKDVVMTTEGYNYTVMNDDVYLYTGITSVSNDEANVGFIMTNMRTKQTTYYKVPGAEEYSAMASAEGQVQQMNYTATFPLLINLNNKPTYLISLKDNAGLVKMYAFVDVVDYQKVVVTEATEGITKAAENYLGDESLNAGGHLLSKEITVSTIANATIDGTTYYYIEDSEEKRYRVSIKIEKEKLPFIEKGEKIKISYKEEKEVTEILGLE